MCKVFLFPLAKYSRRSIFIWKVKLSVKKGDWEQRHLLPEELEIGTNPECFGKVCRMTLAVVFL